MLSSPNRVIKVKRPITKVSVIPTDEFLRSRTAEPPTEEIRSTESENDVQVEAATPPENILKLTEEAFQQELDAAYRKGFSEGQEKGFQEAESQYSEAFQTLQSWLAALKEQQDELIRSAEEPLLKLTLAMGEKILGALAQSQKGLIKVTLKKIIGQCEIAGKIKVFVHPEDLAVVEKLAPDIKQKLPDVTELAVLPEGNISRGGCIMETSLGKLDARIETQLKELNNKLLRQFRDIDQTEPSDL